MIAKTFFIRKVIQNALYLGIAYASKKPAESWRHAGRGN
jgi:hypothetical protein